MFQIFEERELEDNEGGIETQQGSLFLKILCFW